MCLCSLRRTVQFGQEQDNGTETSTADGNEHGSKARIGSSNLSTPVGPSSTITPIASTAKTLAIDPSSAEVAINACHLRTTLL